MRSEISPPIHTLTNFPTPVKVMAIETAAAPAAASVYPPLGIEVNLVLTQNNCLNTMC